MIDNAIYLLKIEYHLLSDMESKLNILFEQVEEIINTNNMNGKTIDEICKIHSDRTTNICKTISDLYDYCNKADRIYTDNISLYCNYTILNKLLSDAKHINLENIMLINSISIDTITVKDIWESDNMDELFEDCYNKIAPIVDKLFDNISDRKEKLGDIILNFDTAEEELNKFVTK